MHFFFSTTFWILINRNSSWKNVFYFLFAIRDTLFSKSLSSSWAWVPCDVFPVTWAITLSHISANIRASHFIQKSVRHMHPWVSEAAHHSWSPSWPWLCWALLTSGWCWQLESSGRHCSPLATGVKGSQELTAPRALRGCWDVELQPSPARRVMLSPGWRCWQARYTGRVSESGQSSLLCPSNIPKARSF